MGTVFRRFTLALRKRGHMSRVASANYVYVESTLTQTVRKARSVDHLTFCHQSQEEMEAKWRRNLQEIFVCPFDMSEFECRVEVLKHAIMLEMDEENATDMDKYNLAMRRNACCTSLLKSDEEKAARMMGILGFV
ncbi:hypothetical protein OS493_029073 [Desmophyllum pertusum]|uniref:Uncharacterized protein n=1 Tax=Desmophyllum pertusum TaxID=174260 RepID=A0A9W9YK59_9CNID|nr:hypothetical protein OS493_029073 [Desmophyllum pertusum]